MELENQQDRVSALLVSNLQLEADNSNERAEADALREQLRRVQVCSCNHQIVRS